MAELKTILRKCMETYARSEVNETVYVIPQMNETVFIVTCIRKAGSEELIDTGIALCVDDKHIIIDREISHRPLLNTFLEAGIPRNQIILQYLGETNSSGE